jgi:hypothetical protein
MTIEEYAGSVMAENNWLTQTLVNKSDRAKLTDDDVNKAMDKHFKLAILIKPSRCRNNAIGRCFIHSGTAKVHIVGPSCAKFIEKSKNHDTTNL